MRIGRKGPFHLLFLMVASAGSLAANAILSTGNLNCTFSMPNPVLTQDCGPGGMNLALASQLPEQSNGISGVSYSLSGALTDTSVGTNSPFNTVLTLSTQGVPAGTGVTAPVSVTMGWDFTLALQFIEGHTQINSWTLTFDLIDVTAANASLFTALPTISSGALNINTTTPTTFIGGQSFALNTSINPLSGDVLKQVTVLTVNWTGQNNNADNLSIQFASRGLDFNDVPEPATVGLSAAALALGLWWRLRR